MVPYSPLARKGAPEFSCFLGSGALASKKRTMRGRIKTWFSDRAFGFITPDDSVQDVFFHLNQTHFEDPHPGQAVEYSLSTDKRGRTSASRVRLVEEDDRSREIEVAWLERRRRHG